MPPDGGAMLQRRDSRQGGCGVLWDLPARVLRLPDDSAARRVFVPADAEEMQFRERTAWQKLPLREPVFFEVQGVPAVPPLRMPVCLPASVRVLSRERQRDGAYYEPGPWAASPEWGGASDEVSGFQERLPFLRRSPFPARASVRSGAVPPRGAVYPQKGARRRKYFRFQSQVCCFRSCQ